MQNTATAHHAHTKTHSTERNAALTTATAAHAQQNTHTNKQTNKKTTHAHQTHSLSAHIKNTMFHERTESHHFGEPCVCVVRLRGAWYPDPESYQTNSDSASATVVHNADARAAHLYGARAQYGDGGCGEMHTRTQNLILSFYLASTRSGFPHHKRRRLEDGATVPLAHTAPFFCVRFYNAASARGSPSPSHYLHWRAAGTPAPQDSPNGRREAHRSLLRCSQCCRRRHLTATARVTSFWWRRGTAIDGPANIAMLFAVMLQCRSVDSRTKR